MKKDAIITLPNPHLRQRSQRIHVVTDEIHELIHNMTSACLDWEASRPHEISAALAAVQIDSLERVIIVRSDFDDKKNQEFIALINPEVIKVEGTPIIIQPEGCLSVSDIYGTVPRYPRIRVRALDQAGKEVRIKAEGFLAMLLQHEIDHTNGIVFVDHIKESTNAFFKLNAKGDLQPLNYEEYIKDNPQLWS